MRPHEGVGGAPGTATLDGQNRRSEARIATTSLYQRGVPETPLPGTFHRRLRAPRTRTSSEVTVPSPARLFSCAISCGERSRSCVAHAGSSTATTRTPSVNETGSAWSATADPTDSRHWPKTKRSAGTGGAPSRVASRSTDSATGRGPGLSPRRGRHVTPHLPGARHHRPRCESRVADTRPAAGETLSTTVPAPAGGAPGVRRTGLGRAR